MKSNVCLKCLFILAPIFGYVVGVLLTKGDCIRSSRVCVQDCSNDQWDNVTFGADSLPDFIKGG